MGSPSPNVKARGFTSKSASQPELLFGESMSKSYRLVAAVMGLTALSACSSGGSGGSSPASATASPAVTTISGPPPAPMVSALQDASLHGSSPLLASASTPDFSTNLPAVGTVFPLSDTVAL